jgi:glycosyltransferase involved in cell wall biosynthesis
VKSKLLYFHAGKSSFVVKDMEILEEKYTIVDFFFDTSLKKKYPLILIRQKLFILANIINTRLIVCQFAGSHAFLPVLFSRLFFKKSVIIAGGTDCVSFPSIHYGNFNNGLQRFATAFSFKNCSLILPVHQTLVEYDYTYQTNDYPKQGYRFFIPGIKTPYEVIHNGYDSNKWFCNSGKEPRSFITIGAGLNSRFGFSLKGIDLIFEIAPKFPDARFYIVGGTSIKKEKPANVQLLDNMPNEQLQPLLSKMQFYMQLSISEGFPNALSEGMLCECIPVVSNVGGMADIVSDCGYVLKHKDMNELYELIYKAINSPEQEKFGKKARQRIVENYPFESRKRKLLAVIDKLL